LKDAVLRMLVERFDGRPLSWKDATMGLALAAFEFKQMALFVPPETPGDGARLLALFLGDHLVDEAVGLLEVLDPVLRVVAAGVLDDAALAEVEAVGLDELDGLDLEAGVVVRRDGVVLLMVLLGK
jgi:hypothetical protein